MQDIRNELTQGNLSLDKNEVVTVVGTSGRVKWRIRKPSGIEVSVPPPDPEAISAAERLKRLFDRTVALWQKKQFRLWQNMMIFATIKVVK